MLAGRRRRAEGEERDRALRDADATLARLQTAAQETASFLQCAAEALSAGAPPSRVADALEIWAGLGRHDALALRRPIAVAGPLAELIEEYRRAAGEDREILYIEDGGGNWLRASIHRPLFVRAIRELLDNVLRHAGGWSRITVTAEPVPGAVVVKVRDDGAAAECRAGLGLRLAGRIAREHGGELGVSFERGRGLTVTTRWPAASGPFSREGDTP